MRRSAFIFLLVLFCGLARAATNGEGYIGCYADAADRDLGLLVKGGDSTPSICRDLCSKANYDYFGLQAGGQCFCDDNYGRYQKSSNCIYPCSADSNFFCGGPWANSIYSVNKDLDHVKLGSRVDGLTHEQLHAGLALMRDLIPAGYDAQTIVAHIKNGTVPAFTSSQIQAVKRSQLPPTSLARRDPSDLTTCIADVISVELDVISFAAGLLGIKQRLTLDGSFIQITGVQAKSFEGLMKIADESTDAVDRAKAIGGLIIGFKNLVGLKAITHMLTAHMTWWDYIKTAVTMIAQFAIWFGTDGVAFIGEAAMELENAVDLYIDIRKARQECGSHPLPPTSLPPASVQIAVMEHLNGTKADVELFLLDAQGSINHRFQLPDLSWTGWQPLPHDRTFYRLAAARNQGGHLEVYGVGNDKTLWQRYQDPATGAWTAWSKMGDPVSEMTAVSNTDGRLEIFAANLNFNVWHRWQNAPNSGWGDWDSVSNSPQVKQFAVAPNQNGNLVLFGLRTDGGISLTRQNANGIRGWENWGDFQASGVSDLVATRNLEIVEAFCIGSDKRVYHRWQTGANSYSWVDWVPLYVQGNSQLTKQAKQLAVAQQSDGRPVLFLIGLDDTVYFTALTPSGWSAWQNPSGSVSTIKAVTTKDGIVQVYALFSGDKNMYVTHQLKATEPLQWTNWVPLN